jgi:prepilin signal peptidase PulO-like enzyme (type II secretory pathway)
VSYVIPDGLLLALIPLVIVWSDYRGMDWRGSLVHSVVVGGSLILLRGGWQLWYGEEALGWGDIKWLSILAFGLPASWLPWWIMTMGLAAIVLGYGYYRPRSIRHIPFAPSITLATAIGYLGAS